MTAIKKQFISPEALRVDSFKLAARIVDSGFKPDFLVAIWRGGAPVGCYVHEFLKYFGIVSDHISIRTSRYSGIDEAQSHVAVHNLAYLLERLTKASRVLLIDDVFDSGFSIQAILCELSKRLESNMPKDIRVATIFYKPSRNQLPRIPDFYVHESDAWLVFPHELEKLSLDEINEHFGSEIAKLVIETRAKISF